MMKVIKYIGVILSLFILLFITYQLKPIRLIVHDNIRDVCNSYYASGEKNSFTSYPEKNSSFYGFYKLEICDVSFHPDNNEFIVKLRGKDNRVYKRAIYKGEAMIRWFISSVSTYTGDEGVCFYLPRKDDPNKKIVEAKIGQPMTKYNRRVDGYCI